jgi:hypothetical protein
MKRKIPITEMELKLQGYSYVTEVGSWNRVGVAWQVWKHDSQLIIYDPISQHVVGDLTKLIISFYENFT